MFYSTLAAVDLMMWRALEEYDCDRAAIFERAGVDPAMLHRSGARIPLKAGNRLWDLARRATADPCLGLRVAAHWHPTALHALGYAWLASDSLRDALQRLVRYYRVITDTEWLELDAGDDEVMLRVHLVDETLRGVDEIYDGFFASLVRMCRFSYGDAFAPRQISMMRPRPAGCANEFDGLFRAPIEYGASDDVIVFAAGPLDTKLPTGNVEIAHASDRIITDYIAHLERARVTMRVKARLIDELPSGHTTQESIARSLHMSLRSLQRRLAAEGTSYRELLDETRSELAQQYVRQSRLSLGEITFLLGFSEPGNFTRAFKRWTGKPPSAYRRSA